ncbi:hypothetical protein [Nocardioides sp. B-3]|uniref:hypothetical protein n=1 Tax=Nocardioides sp. B-3 TaxID=2895565 RepID=UPI00215305DD|nr:hypothetical protein [Nocardioides sp. B-3]UUZ59815.1 hypothetical protein LP418_01655 [Nocardioides sp. B-3]
MTRTRRITATLIATAALVAPTAALQSAVAAEGPTTSVSDKAAKAPKAPKSLKAQTKQLLKDVAGKDKRPARLAASNAVASPADDTEAELVANITDARTAPATAKTTIEAADSTMDTRAARKDLRSFRVVNFRLALNILKQAEGLAEAAAADPEAVSHLALAEDAALAITAASTKADVKAARAHLREARAELEPAEEETAAPAPAV